MIKTIGIIGYGVVGNAMYESFKNDFEILIYDKFKKQHNTIKDENSLQELVALMDGPIFVCVPTPSNHDGSCDISIVDEVCKLINEAQMKKVTEQSCYCNCCGISEQVVVIRSTVCPNTCDMLMEKYPYISICYNPEFLTERTAVDDFKNQTDIVIGGDKKIIDFVSFYYKKVFKNIRIHHTTRKLAEVLKYTTNAFFALKITYANQLKMYCDNISVDYDSLKSLFVADHRLGSTHWDVPGPDGSNGFGGKCLPKDTWGLLKNSKKENFDFSILEKVLEINGNIRN